MFAFDPADFTLRTLPQRFASLEDRHAAIADVPCASDSILELAAKHEREGLGDSPWPPHYEERAGEESRASPSMRKESSPTASATARHRPTKPLL